MSTVTAAEVAAITRTIQIPNDGLRQIANVALFASTDETLPTLCAVRLHSDGIILTAEATDRYCAAREIIQLQDTFENESELSEWDTFDVLVEVTGLVKATKIKSGPYSQPVTIAVNGQTVTFDNGDDMARANLVDGEPVDLDRLRIFEPYTVGDDRIDREEAPPLTIGINPQFLTKLAKVRTEVSYRKGSIVPCLRWTIATPGKPYQMAWDDTFRLVIMPVNVS